MSTDDSLPGGVVDPPGSNGSPIVPDVEATADARRRPVAEFEHRLVDLEHALVYEEQRLAGEVSHVAHRVKAGTGGKLWSRLNAVDFMNSSMQFAALGVLCFFPLLVLAFAGTGRDGRDTLIERMGLDRRAAQDVNSLMSSGTHAVATFSVLGGAIVALGAIGLASTLQTWYQRVYDQPRPRGWVRQLADRLLWIVGLLFYFGLQGFVGRELGHAEGRVPVFAVTFVIAVAFFWWTVHVLLCGRVGWREAFPAGLATGICATGLSVFSTILFSSQIVGGERDYGAIGVVSVLLSWLIGWAVCLHIGAVAGRMWNERRLPPPPDDHPEVAPA